MKSLFFIFKAFTIFFIPIICIAADRVTLPIIVGDSWSDDQEDWPNFTVTVPWDNYRNHAIGAEWLSVRDATNKIGMAANIADYLDLHPEADSIIIQGGIGDIRNSVNADVIKSALLFIVTEAKSRSNIVDIIVMSPGPFGRSWKWNLERQAELDDYLNWLPDFCLSQNIPCYNTYEAVGDPNNPIIISDGTDGTPDYDLDGLHLNLVGAAKVGDDMDMLINVIRGGPVPIRADVAPWSNENLVFPASNNPILLALLSVADAPSYTLNLDASQIDPASVRFGPGEAANKAQPTFDDYDGDMHGDILLGFTTQDSGIACGDTEVNIFGETYAGESFIAEASINTTDCTTTGCHP
jgi:lysophospholipase L1-like esterase